MALKFEFHPRWREILPFLVGDSADPLEAARALEKRDREEEDFLNTLGGGAAGTGAIVMQKVYSASGNMPVPTFGPGDTGRNVTASLTFTIPADLDPTKEYRCLLQSQIDGYANVSSESPGPRAIYMNCDHFHDSGQLVPPAYVLVTGQDYNIPSISTCAVTVPVTGRFTVLPGQTRTVNTRATNQSGGIYDPTKIYSLGIEMVTVMTIVQLDPGLV